MGESVSESTSPSLRDYFNELFTYALSIGMTPHQYWEEETDLFLNYYEAEKMRQQRRNTECWLSGLYVNYAVASCLNKHAKYPKKPIPLTQEEVDERNNASLLRLREELRAEAERK